MSERIEIKPDCRYGHGELEEQLLQIKEGQKARFFSTPTMTDMGSAVNYDGGGFTHKIFRCPKCGYVEIFDDWAHYG